MAAVLPASTKELLWTLLLIIGVLIVMLARLAGVQFFVSAPLYVLFLLLMYVRFGWLFELAARLLGLYFRYAGS